MWTTTLVSMNTALHHILAPHGFVTLCTNTSLYKVVFFPHTWVVQDVDQKLWPGAESNIKLHLIKLLEEEKVTKTESKDSLVRWSLVLKHKL